MNENKPYTARVKLPSRNTLLQSWTDLTLDLAMSCLGTRDEDCPIWYVSHLVDSARTLFVHSPPMVRIRDRLYFMRVCCDGSPDGLCQKELGR